MLLDHQFNTIPLGDPTWDVLDLYDPVSSEQIVNAMVDLGHLRYLTKPSGPLPYSGSERNKKDNEPGLEEKKGPVLYLLQQCEFFKRAATVPLRYEEWIALASNLGVFEGGRTLFHKLSALDKRYDRVQADEKFTDIQTNFRSVITCTRLADFGWRCPCLGDDGQCQRFTKGDRGAKAPAAAVHYLGR
jgi:hypothetical protein